MGLSRKIKSVVIFVLLLSLSLFSFVTAQGIEQQSSIEKVTPSFEVLKNIPLPEKSAVNSWDEAIPLSQLIEEKGKKCFCSELVFCSFECLDTIRSGEEYANDCECAIEKVSKAKAKSKEDFTILGIPCECGGYIVSNRFYTSGWRPVDAYLCNNSAHAGVGCVIRKSVRDHHYEYSCGGCGYYFVNVSQEYKEEHIY